MQGVVSSEGKSLPPGMVILISGEILRYADAGASIMDLMVPAYSARDWRRGCMVAKSLNMAIANFYEHERQHHSHKKLEWIWIMGDDHTFDPDVVLRLLERDEPVVGPLCLNRAPPFYPTIHQHAEGQPVRIKPLSEMPTSGLYTLKENETCGDSGLLIRREVLDKIPMPWYERQHGSGALSAEDQVFTAKLRDAGFPVKIDCDVVIGHMTPLTITPVLIDDKWHVQFKATGVPFANMRFHRPSEVPESETGEPHFDVRDPNAAMEPAE